MLSYHPQMDGGVTQHESIDDPRLQAGFVPADPDLTASVRRRARTVFGASAELLVVVPGRIEIVGNHVDYNGGEVLAAAVDRWVAVAARRRSDGQLRVMSGDLGSAGETFPVADCLDFDSRVMGDAARSSDAVRATVAALHASGITSGGSDLFYRGTIPPGVGLSSSSALLVALACALAELADEARSPLDIARVAMDAEHRTGTPVGLMDHTASAVGGILRFSNNPGRVRVLDAHLGEALFALVDSGVRHGMPGSRYAVRVAECREALGLLRASGYEIASLADLPRNELEPAIARLPSHLADRVRHVVEEVVRVGDAETALESGELSRLGEVMNASGHSSATLYDISHPAVEAVAAAARSVPGVYGARMMGGGDGGSAIALIDREAVPSLAEHLPSHTITVCRIARGMSLSRE